MNDGRVHCAVFAGESLRFVSGATVTIAGGSTALTDARGNAFVSVAQGTHELSVIIPSDRLPAKPKSGAASVRVSVPNVPVVAGELTVILMSVSETGEPLDTDVRVPEAALSAAQAQAPPSAAAPSSGVVAGEGEGLLSGLTVSAKTGKPIVDAKVFAVGQTAEAATDGSGRFTLSLPEGTHVLSVVHFDYVGQTLEGLVVEQGVQGELTIRLEPAPVEMDTFVVRAPRIRGSVATLMEERRESAQVKDSIGSEDIARMPAGSAAQAAQRIVGATIVGGRFVYVRGLGERYTNALLNGAPLPSPEPDRATVPLDLFPAQILETLDINKTFTPDVPADFAGGSVRITTRSVPDEPLFSASLSTSANSESTFQSGYGQPAGSTDFLGWDDGGRALPGSVPTRYPLSLGVQKPNGEQVLAEELNAQGKHINSPMSVEKTTNLPNLSGSIAAGDGFSLGGDKRVGVLGSLVYGRSFVRREMELNEYQSSTSAAHGLQPWSTFDVERMSDEVRWGAFASSSLELGKAHELTLLGMRSQLADTRTSLFDGFSQNTVSSLASTRLEFISRALDFGQLQGRHDFEELNDAELDWTLSLASAQRDEPDTRDVVYQRHAETMQWSYLDGTESGRHFFSTQDETSKTFGLDWLQPITGGDVATKLKAGGMATLKDRTFRGRRFTLRPRPTADRDVLACGDSFDPITCPEQLFTDENIGDVLRLEEGTRPGDAYDAALYVYAAYLMGELSLGEKWRLIGGARVEVTDQVVVPYDAFARREDRSVKNTLESTDLLPAASIVYSPWTDFSIRAAISRTLARPQLRELAPFAFSDYFGGAQNSGNPDLRLTGILNGDLRFEYFPTTREVLAVSFFAKDFTDPIEPVFIPSSTTNVLTYRNALGASLFGVELEARKSLSVISRALSDFTLIASLMLADSSIRVRQTGDAFLTNTERPLVQAAPYVINASIDYENKDKTQVRVLYNVTGPRLVEVGTDFLEDAYLHPQHLVDLTASQGLGEHFRLRLSLQNLLDSAVLVTQGKSDKGYNVRQRWKEGVTGSIGVSYTH